MPRRPSPRPYLRRRRADHAHSCRCPITRPCAMALCLELARSWRSPWSQPRRWSARSSARSWGTAAGGRAAVSGAA
jgi:hypothetical protein